MFLLIIIFSAFRRFFIHFYQFSLWFSSFFPTFAGNNTDNHEADSTIRPWAGDSPIHHGAGREARHHTRRSHEQLAACPPALSAGRLADRQPRRRHALRRSPCRRRRGHLQAGQGRSRLHPRVHQPSARMALCHKGRLLARQHRHGQEAPAGNLAAQGQPDVRQDFARRQAGGLRLEKQHLLRALHHGRHRPHPPDYRRQRDNRQRHLRLGV